MRDIYCISGLGADHRIFSRLDIPGVNLLPVPWLKPERLESMGSYAARMKAGIVAENPIILGVSFGGMMALEMAKLYTSPTVIIVSSVRDYYQLPYWMRVSGKLRLNQLGLNRLRSMIRPWRLSLPERYFMGVESGEDAALIRAFKAATDPRYLKWAVNRILNWKNEWQPAAFYHLHGSKDRIFPLRRVQPTHIVPEAGHLMIHNRAEAVSAIISGICAKIG